MQQARTATAFPQVPLRNHAEGLALQRRPDSRRAGAKSTAAAKKSRPFAFLKQRIESKCFIEERNFEEAEVDLQASYNNSLRNIRRLLDFAGCKKEYEEKDLPVARQVSDLAVWFKHVCETYLDDYCTFTLCHYVPSKEIVPVIYHDGTAMDWVYVVFYAEPCQTLPEKASKVYKDFMGWLCDALGIGPGVDLNEDNTYLDSIMMMYEESTYYSENEADDDDKWRGEVYRKYRFDGEYGKLFKEISEIKITTEEIEKELDDCRMEFFDIDNDVSKLMLCLMEGLRIIERMHVPWWCFCPKDDGLPESWDEGYGTDSILIPLSTCILYGPSDGIADEIESMLNAEYSGGADLVGWNRSLYLTERMTKEDYEDYEADRHSCAEFAKWNTAYFSAIQKFVNERTEDE